MKNEYYSLKISTHTLTWSVTLHLSTITPLLKFQLTRSRGAWQEEPTEEEPTEDFNSHAHVERDACIGDDGSNTIHFNSHAHVERD